MHLLLISHKYTINTHMHDTCNMYMNFAIMLHDNNYTLTRSRWKTYNHYVIMVYYIM